jgi:hypothetical protein
MKNIYDAFSTNPKSESDEGVVLQYGENINIRIHRAGGANQKYKNYARAKLAPYMRQINAGTLDENVTRGLMIDVYARTVIVGWEGVTDKKGNPLDFTRENVVQVLTDLPELFDDIQKAAQEAALFRDAIQEDILGNSDKPSVGS